MSLIDSASLIVTPNAYKEGTLYSVIPSDGSGDLSVTRATTATRVNSAGLVELVPYNLLTYSEQFNNAAWATNNSPTITANTTTAPNGTLTADTISAGGANSGVYQVPSVSTSSSYTFSVYVKNISNATAITIGCDLNPTNGRLVFNAVSGTIASVSGGITASGVTNEGNGWFRVFGTYVATNTPNTFIVFGGGVMSFAVWGAQLVEGSVAKDYQKTETRLNIPRLDYSNGTCPSILVEPQRTNLLTYSSSFDNAAWTKLRLNVTANTTTAPDGTLTADKIIANTDNSDHSIFQSPITSSSPATLSIYAKAGEYNYIFLGYDNGLANQGAFFNLSNGTISQNTSGFTASIQSVGNGWYRCTLSSGSSNWGTTYSIISLSENGTSFIFAGDNSKGVFIWGAQAEQGSYQTSYIPTTSASVTRNADVISKTGISSLIGQTEGSVFWEGQITSVQGGAQLFDLNADGDKYIQIFNSLVSGVPRISIYVQNVSVLLYNLNIATIAFDTNFKFALAYKNNDYVAYLNGVQVYANTTIGVPPTSNFGLTSAGQGAETSGKNIKAAALWKTRLTNDELERLTGVGFNTYTEMANYYNYITQ